MFPFTPFSTTWRKVISSKIAGVKQKTKTHIIYCLNELKSKIIEETLTPTFSKKLEKERFINPNPKNIPKDKIMDKIK